MLQGFGANGDNIGEFVNFSWSVQNRRKSGVGFAFENHLGHLFKLHDLKFEKSSSKNTTEKKLKPDVFSPSFEACHDQNFDSENCSYPVQK